MRKGIKIFIWIIVGVFLLLFIIGLLAPEEAEQESAKGNGKFLVQYTPTKNVEYQAIERSYRELKLYEDIAEELTKSLNLQKNVNIVLQECGEANAFYDPTKGSIIMCYEMIDYIAEAFVDVAETEEELRKWTSDAMFFIFFHELGHALVDHFDLPITGKEEDSVDQISTIILSEVGEEGEVAALNGAYFFLIQGENTKAEDLAFWDEHSLDKQRFYNIACWVYGKNPKTHTYLIKDRLLDEERAVRCEQEYVKMSSSWNRILEPYIRQ